MWVIVFKIVISVAVLIFVSWLSGKKTDLAGFITALPIITLLALAFGHLEWKDPQQSVDYAKKIFLALPLTLLFFIPFLLAQRLNLGFWSSYFSGLLLLGLGYFIHLHASKWI